MTFNAKVESRSDARLVQTDLGLGKQVLALDALSKLTQHFANSPNFGELINTLLLTLSGQFATANSFALIRNPNSGSKPFTFYGTGKLTSMQSLQCLELDENTTHRLARGDRLLRVCELIKLGYSEEFSTRLEEAGVVLLSQVIHKQRFLGIVGIGEKVKKRPFSESEIEFLSTVIDSITPFLGSSYLFWEIASLSDWHLSILNNVKQAVFVFNFELVLKTTNEVAESILEACGSTANASDGSVPLYLDDVFSEAQFRDWSSRLKRTTDSRSDILYENMVADLSGGRKVFNVNVSHIQGAEQERSDLIVTLEDVTDQKENEHRLFELQKFADKGVMASSIAHELNNFLALLLGGIEMTQISFSRNDMEKITANLSKLKDYVTKMERFTAGLMDYTKTETSKQKTNLNSIIDDVLSFVTVQKRFKMIDLKTDLMDVLPLIDLDSDQIAQLLLNFLNNAADAIREAKRSEGKISVSTKTENGSMLLKIADNGCGIPDDVKEKLFKNRLTTKESGHGYGLVTCAKIIENHQANISINSEVGKGTTFTLRFPC